MAARQRRRRTVSIALALGLALVLLPATRGTADPGPTTLVGLTDAGVAPENGAGAPVISGDGSTVVFRSFGTDIDEGAPEMSRLFARNRATSTTEAVDLPPPGATFPNNRGTDWIDVSADGRYVVFGMQDNDNCENENGRDCVDLYRRDLQTNTTDLVSVSTDGSTRGNGDSVDPSISADGQRVAFTSQATNLVGTARGAIQNVYVRDYAVGTGTTELVSRSSVGDPGDNISQQASISADGDAVAFYSAANNLDPSGPPSNDLFVHHLDTDETEAVLPSGQTYPEGQTQPVLNADGTVLAFVTRNDVLGTGASTDESRIYTIDLADDTVRTAPAHDFVAETDPDISDDGRYVAYRTEEPKAGGVAGVYVWDREAATEVESVGSDGTAMSTQAFQSFMSGDGRFVVFDTLESAYPDDEPGATIDSLVHDRAEPTETASGTGAASTGSPGGPTYDDTLEATVSGSPGEVTITELETEDPEAPPIDGYVVLGQQVQITADPPTPPGFLTFTFDIDESVIPANAVPGDVDLFRDGAALRNCTGTTDVGPCVASRTVLPSGDWRFVAHSPEASVWAVALDLTPDPTPTDDIAPTITITRPVDGATYRVGQSVTASYQCTDADSGIATCQGTRPNGATISTSSTGTTSFTVTAADNAGNTSTKTVSYTVVWPLTGLFQPVDNPPVLNLEKAGAVIPVRFSLGGYRGTQVFASGYPQTTAVPCQARPRTDEIEQTLARSAATLTYRSGVYTYAWRSQQAWASRFVCRKVVLRFKDGQERTALFRLR